MEHAARAIVHRVFVLGIPRSSEPAPLFEETLRAVQASTASPAYTIVVDNGDERFAVDGSQAVVIRPSANVGRAGAWNIVLRLAFETLSVGRAVLLDGDLAVAPDTFDRMLASQASVVCAHGFSCFRLDEAPWRTVGEFDEEFWPSSFEDADYRRRLALAGVPVEEWPIEEHSRAAQGRVTRVTYASGIAHNRTDRHRGWSARRVARLRTELEANRKRYAQKWGGLPGAETLSTPFNALR